MVIMLTGCVYDARDTRLWCGCLTGIRRDVRGGGVDARRDQVRKADAVSGLRRLLSDGALVLSADFDKGVRKEWEQ